MDEDQIQTEPIAVELNIDTIGDFYLQYYRSIKELKRAHPVDQEPNAFDLPIPVTKSEPQPENAAVAYSEIRDFHLILPGIDSKHSS